MYLLVLFLLLSLYPNKSSAEFPKTGNEKHISNKEEIPFAVFTCENYNKKQEKITLNYNQKTVQNISNFHFISNSNWTNEIQALLKKQQETEYQIFGSKSWPPHTPFSISPLIEKNGLLVFINYPGEISINAVPISSQFVLFYQKKVLIGKSQEEINAALTEYLPKLNKRDGVRFYISKEVPGESIGELEKVIKNFTADKNSIIIPYEVTSDGIRYKSDIETSRIMQAIKQINQFVPSLSARIPNGTNDIIEVTRSK